jgi:hypothetical protein
MTLGGSSTQRQKEKIITVAGWLKSARDLARILERRIEENISKSTRAEPEELRKTLYELSLTVLDIHKDIMKILRGAMAELKEAEK